MAAKPGPGKKHRSKSAAERKRAEPSLQESEDRYRYLFENMALGVVYHDATGRIITANPAAERILGLSYDQMVGRTSIDPRWKAIHEDGSDFPGETHPAMKHACRKRIRSPAAQSSALRSGRGARMA